MIARSASPLCRTISTNSRWRGVRLESRRIPVIPMIAFIGVRISWLIVARKALLARLAASAAERASASSRSRRSASASFSASASRSSCSASTVASRRRRISSIWTNCWTTRSAVMREASLATSTSRARRAFSSRSLSAEVSGAATGQAPTRTEPARRPIRTAWTVQTRQASNERTTCPSSTGFSTSATGVPTRASSIGPRRPTSSRGEAFQEVGVTIWYRSIRPSASVTQCPSAPRAAETSPAPRPLPSSPGGT